jgi:sugar phosphate isomerase/epimerase
VGLLYQPTVFERESALAQLQIQKPFIRHLHLQNRNPDLSFATLRDGVIPWPEILTEIGEKAGATIEFVPEGICPEETFDLQATLRQAREETDYLGTLHF